MFLEMKTNVELTFQQVDLLRGILYEYYKVNEYLCETEKIIHAEIELILANAENEIHDGVEE
jgi:hypothetical protein